MLSSATSGAVVSVQAFPCKGTVARAAVSNLLHIVTTRIKHRGLFLLKKVATNDYD